MGWVCALPVSLGWYKAKSQNICESTMQIATHSPNVKYTIFLKFEPNKNIYNRSGDTGPKESHKHVDKLGMSKEHL